MKLGIIGLGYWGKHYIRIINNSERAKLTAICDMNLDALSNYNYLNVSKFTDYIEMFKSNEINGVIIVTIAKTHDIIIKEAIKYNLKIFVEKPYVLTVNLCHEINSLLKPENKLMVGHTYLFNPKINYIKNFLESNMKNIKSINFEWTCYGPIRKDTTPIFDLAVHPFSILLLLFPNKQITNITSICSSTKHTYFVMLKIDEIIVSLNISWASPGKRRQMMINNDDCKVIFDDVTNIEPIKILYSENSNNTTIIPNPIHTDGQIIIPQISNIEPLTDQFNHWLDYIENKCECISDENFSTEIIKLCENIENIL